MLYVIYRKDLDLNNLVTSSIKDAIERSTEIVDNKELDNKNFLVEVYSLTEEEYNTADTVKCDKELSLEDFIKVAKYPEDISLYKPSIPMANADAFHHLDDDQIREVLKYTSDSLIFEEINRRISEYRSTLDKITEAMDLMKIWK